MPDHRIRRRDESKGGGPFGNLRILPCESVQEARENVAIALGRTKEGDEELWVAEVDGRAIGFMLLEFARIWGHKGEAFEEEAGRIDWLDVHPEFQRRGIGKELLPV